MTAATHPAGPTGATRPATTGRRRGRSVRSLTNQVFGVLAVLLLLAGVVIGTSIARLTGTAGDVADRIGPSVIAAGQLLTALVDQETGIRGYALSGQTASLEPWTRGLAEQDVATAAVRRGLPSGPGVRADLAAELAAADAWRTAVARPVIAAVAAGDRARAAAIAAAPAAKARFDAIRSRAAELGGALLGARAAAVRRLHEATVTLGVVTGLAALLVLAGALLGFVGLRRQVTGPVARLAGETRRVVAGDLDHPVAGGGPAELDDLARDVEAMRGRMVAELQDAERARAEADRTSASLARSNADLEQFAYVASHDLQEPLRKVSNFCQLLERQYADQLDDRARQYIGFAVDGAKRMQVLINDLLAFSRVGRTSEGLVPVDTGRALDVALDNLSDALARTSATVERASTLPTVRGDPTLLATLFQNLVGNAVKYHGDDPPRVEISAHRQPVPADAPVQWEFAVRDNGIGIDPRYAERIFVIFQRLHLRDAYGGTGIGLALCKKIVEYHGGTIWLDPDGGPGSRFCFTLPEEATA